MLNMVLQLSPIATGFLTAAHRPGSRTPTPNVFELSASSTEAMFMLFLSFTTSLLDFFCMVDARARSSTSCGPTDPDPEASSHSPIPVRPLRADTAGANSSSPFSESNGMSDSWKRVSSVAAVGSTDSEPAAVAR